MSQVLPAQLPAGALPLKQAMEGHADVISNSAQIILEFIDCEETPELVQRDLSRINESALSIYRMVRSHLTVEHFENVSSKDEELHTIRHDLRGMLQNVLLRGQMVLEIETFEGQQERLTSLVRPELERILKHARLSVESLDANRDLDPADEISISDLAHDQDLSADAMRTVQQVEEANILIADDNENSREMLGRFLTGEGHTVAEAKTGREALDRLKETDFDLLLLDLMMPEMNGFEVLETLSENGSLRHLPVIVISGLDTDANALRGIELGAVDFLPRPVNLKLLRARANAAVERRRLREKELSSYFTPELARYLLRHPEELTRRRSAEVSVLFCDISSFSRISEKLGAERAISWVSDVLSAMSSCVMDQKGVLVDYTGDEVMAMWGAPGQQPDHASRACQCAIEMREKLPELDQEWEKIIGEPVEVRIGINTGSAFVGNVGTPQKFKFGPIGTTVNVASRIQNANKFVQTRLLLSGDTWNKIGDEFKTRKVADVRVNNIERPVALHELDVSPGDELAKLRNSYEEALECFEKNDLPAAEALLGQLSLEFPDDGPTHILRMRVEEALLHSEPEEFDPVWTLPGK